MANTSKPLSDRDASQTLQASYNEVNDTLGVDGFIVGKVGRKVEITSPSSTVDRFTFSENGTTLYVLEITYNNPAHDITVSVERIS